MSGQLPAVENIKMAMDEDAAAFLMASISSNLYTDPVRGAVRETFFNALDSHEKAGQARPVEVILPTPLNPNIVVRDFGVGLSLQEVRAMYSKFGGSDKRGSNDARGGFGLGSKSPLAVSPHFTFTAVKDGEKIVVLVTKDDDGIPVMKVLSKEQTGDVNGVEVVIPYAHAERTRSSIRDLFATVCPGAVHIDGHEPETSVHDRSAWLPVGELGWWRLSGSPVRNRVSVDVLGAHYPVPDTAQVATGLHGRDIVLSIPNGQVAFSTSRDALLPTPATIRAIEARMAAFEDALPGVLEAEMAACNTHAEALHVARSFPATLTPCWRGEEVPSGWVSLPRPATQVGRERGDSGLVAKVALDSRYRWVQAEDALIGRAVNCVRTLRTEAKRNDTPWVPVLISELPVTELSPWVQAVMEELPMDTLREQARAARPARTASTAQREGAPRQLTVMNTDGQPVRTDCDELLKMDRVCYMHPSDLRGFGELLRPFTTAFSGRVDPTPALGAARLLAHHGYTLVRLRSNERPGVALPGVANVSDVLAALLEALVADADELMNTARAASLSSGWRVLRECVSNDVQVLEDPVVRDCVTLPRQDEARLLREMTAALSHPMSRTITGSLADRLRELYTEVRKPPLAYGMPLLSSVWGGFLPEDLSQHLVWYVNACFAEHLRSSASTHRA